MSIVLTMIGVSGSGKSFLAKALAEEIGAVVLSSDENRERISGDAGNQECSREAFEMLFREIGEYTEAGRNVVVDTTGLKARARRQIRDACKGEVRHIAVLLLTPLNVCKDRQAMRNRKVPFDVIDRQWQSYQHLTDFQKLSSEPYEEIWSLSFEDQEFRRDRKLETA